MNLSEQVAKAIVECLLPCSTMIFRPNQSAGESDFILQFPGGQGLVEVTTAADENRLATIGAINNPKRGGHHIPAEKCKRYWRIYPLSNANINKIRKSSIDAHLTQLETEGYFDFYAPRQYVKSKTIKSIYQDLRIESGFSYQNGKSLIYIECPGQWTLDPTSDLLQTAIRAEAYKEDNRNKLRSSPDGKGLLFVYVDLNNYSLWRVLVDEMLPAEPPDLPPEIANVWVSAQTGSQNEYVVYRAARDERWKTPIRVELSAGLDLPGTLP